MEFENVEVGTEQPPIEAKRVLVLSLEEKEVKDKSGKDIGKKLVIKIRHPDIPEMEISKVKYEKNQKIVESGLWLTMDKDGKIPYNSATSALLRYYNCSNLGQLKGKEIDTATDENGFIIAKAY